MATSDDTTDPVVRRRNWLAKFEDAFRGMKLGIRGHSSFSVHFFMAAIVIAAAIPLRLCVWQWCTLVGCITAVLAAEMFNSAIEILCRAIDIEQHPEGKQPLDIAAGAVLTVSIGSSVVGILIFTARLAEMLR